MEKDFFKEHYPHISSLYFDYINKEEYANSSIVKFVESYTSKCLDRVLEQLKQGNENKASDGLTNCACTYEQSGFILGFQYAMNLIRESYS